MYGSLVEKSATELHYTDQARIYTAKTERIKGEGASPHSSVFIRALSV